MFQQKARHPASPVCMAMDRDTERERERQQREREGDVRVYERSIYVARCHVQLVS